MTAPETSDLPRHIVHPGPIQSERIIAIECRVHKVTLTLRPGCSVNVAIADAFAAAGFAGGYVHLKDVAMKRLDYVMPAASPDASHAAWYSDTYVMDRATIVEAGLHAGRRDGQPFLHCHGTWQAADGPIGMGHLLPYDCEFLHETQVEALALDGALLVTQPDAETNFPLFTPKADAAGMVDGGMRAVLCMVRPNTDMPTAVETVCTRFGLNAASVHGIGSLVGAEYMDGTVLTAHASELYIRNGKVCAGEAVIDIAMVDLTGRFSGGVLVRGRNPVCVTAEILLVEM